MLTYKQIIISVFALIMLLVSTAKAQAVETKSQNYVYVSLRDDDAILVYKMDANTGELTLVEKKVVIGAPGTFTFSPDKNFLYTSQRTEKKLSVYKIDKNTGRLNYLNTIDAVDIPVYAATDKTGKYLLTSYYAAGKAAIYSIENDGKLKEGALQIIEQYQTPHSIQTDATNKILFIPDTRGNVIYQFLFDQNSGKLTTNNPPEVKIENREGPRHFTFHGEKNIVYFVNESNNTVTAYHIDKEKGTLKAFQNISTLPSDFSERSSCADIHITPDNRFLYASNRGHNSITGFSINNDDGTLTLIDYFLTEKTPREFEIDHSGKFLVAAGETSDHIAVNKIDQDTGRLTTVQVIHAGKAPFWVKIANFSN